MKSKTIIIWSLIICIILYLIPNGIYYYNFNINKINGLSSNPNNWGVYGDFIGGSLNPILTIFNIIALVYLTYTVAHVEDNRAKENIDAQKIITLTQMRYDAVSELAKAESVLSKHGIPPAESLEEISLQVLFFRDHLVYLFKELFTKEFDQKYYLPFSDSIEAVKKFNEKYPKGTKIASDEVSEKAKEIFYNYLKTRSSFFQEINKLIIEDISPKK